MLVGVSRGRRLFAVDDVAGGVRRRRGRGGATRFVRRSGDADQTTTGVADKQHGADQCGGSRPDTGVVKKGCRCRPPPQPHRQMQHGKVAKHTGSTRSPNEKRSRNGCLTCRRRRVKCDETHPKCSHCTRLNLACSYSKCFSWDEEALGNGVTFGRSNQYKKLSLQQKFESFISSAHTAASAAAGVSADEDTYSSFLRSETSTLSQAVQRENISWCRMRHKSVHFINVTYSDFRKHLAETPDSSTTTHPQNAVTSSSTTSTSTTAMQLLSSLLTRNYDCYLRSSSSSSSSSSQLFPSATPKHLIELLDDSTFHQTANSSLISPDLHQAISLYSPSNVVELPASMSFSELDQLFWSFEPKPPLFSLDGLKAQPSFISNKFDALSYQEKTLLRYFIDAICPSCICYPNQADMNSQNSLVGDPFSANQSKANPYLNLIVPLAMQSQIVMDALMAASAHQLFILGNSSYETISDAYSEKTIKQLTIIIKHKQESQSTDWDDFLAAVLMLCFKEISSDRDYRSWVSYLNCAKHFLQRFSSQNSFSPLYKFFARYFIIHEVIGETAWIQKRANEHDFNSLEMGSELALPSDVVTIDLNFSLNRESGLNDITKYLPNDSSNGGYYSSTSEKDTAIDLVFGCCPYLITLIHKISNLGRCYEDLEMEPLSTRKEFEEYILNQRDDIQSEVEKLDQRIQLFPEINDQSEYCIKTIAEIKRLSTLLYLFARVDLETLYYNNGHVTAQYLEKFEYMKSMKARLINLFKNLPQCPMSLLWPLFVLGLVAATDDEERWFVLDKLVYLQKARELGNVKTAKDVVLAIWKERDLGLISFRWKDMIRGKTESLSLA